MIAIRGAESDADIAQVRRLISLFRDWLGCLYPDDPKSVDANFASVEAELADLPGDYAVPDARLLLAACDGQVVGMVAMRSLGNDSCEMKRLFVDPSFHGGGAGRALAEAVVAEARRAGYARMRLDTGHRQTAAIGLYRHLGFREIEPYYEVSAQLRADLIFMELALSP